MFGTNNNQQDSDDPAMLDNVNQLVSQPITQVEPQQTKATPVTNPVSSNPGHVEPAQGFNNNPSATNNLASQQQKDTKNSNTNSDSPRISLPGDSPPTSTAPQPASDVNQEELSNIKQQALDHLEPLVSHLDQTPEETFKTTMMMIQANDNHTLLIKALESAKKISDDKIRAQAMLDIINEINYFSQNKLTS